MARPSRRRLAAFCPNLGIGLLLLSAPSSVAAQSPAPQSPDPQEPELPDTVPSPPRWRYSLALLGGYETNIVFGGPLIDNFAGSLRASLGRSWRGPRGQLGFSMGGSGVVYPEQRAANRADGGAGLAWSQQLSQRVGFSLSGRGGYGNTTSQRFVTDVGQVLPRANSWNAGGQAGFNFKLGRRTSLRLGWSFGLVNFGGDTTLVDSQAAAGQTGMSWRLGAKDEISLSYGFQRTDDESQGPLGNHNGALGWTRRLSRRLSLSLSGGAGYNPRTAGAIAQAWYFQGSAGLQGQWRRASLGAQVSQSVTPAYGLGGNQISDTATLSAALPFGRRVQLSLAGGHTWGRSRSGNQTPYVSDAATLSLGIRLSRHAGLETGYNYRRSKPDNGPALDAQRGYFGFTYSGP